MWTFRTDLIKTFFRDYLREGVGSVGSCGGEGGEESGSAGCFDGIDHAAPRLSQMGGLSEGADEHEHVIHPCGAVREQRGRGL